MADFSATVLLRTEQSDDRVGIVEVTVPAGWPGPPLHHHAFDEAFYVLDGELTFQLGDELATAGPGSLTFAPAGSHHTLANRSERPRALRARLHAGRLRAAVRPRAAQAVPRDDRGRSADRRGVMSDRGAISGLVAGVSFVAGIGGAMARSTLPYPRPGSSPAEVRRYFTESAGPARLSATGQLGRPSRSGASPRPLLGWPAGRRHCAPRRSPGAASPPRRWRLPGCARQP